MMFNDNIRKSKEKKCPYCNSNNINIEYELSGHIDNSGKHIPSNYMAICRNCHKEFILEKDK
ncbi:MAG: hypothetical protein ACTSRP_17540 [Candidatus Helarchaeota archaeon]